MWYRFILLVLWVCVMVMFELDLVLVSSLIFVLLWVCEGVLVSLVRCWFFSVVLCC